MKPRYFYNHSTDQIYEVIQNPCGCCPCDLMLTWGKRFNESCSISFEDDVEVEIYLEKWIEL